MQANSPLIDFDAVCQKVRAAVEPNRTHAVSLHDEAGDVLWLSESSMGPDEHNAVREAAEAFSNPAAAPILSFDLGDSRSAVMVRAVNARRAIVGLIMIVMDTRIVAQGAPKLMTPKLQRALVQFAGMRPDRGPAMPEADPAPSARVPAPTALRAAPPTAPAPRPAAAHSPAAHPLTAHAAAASAPLSVGPKTIAAQLEQIVSRGTVRTPTPNPAKASRPATYVSHVGAARPTPPARAAAPAAATPEELLEPVEPAGKSHPHKGVPPEIDRLNAAMRKSPIALHVQRLVPLSKGSQVKRYEVLLRSGSEEAPNAAPHAMLKAAVENGLGSMIDRRVITELIGWLVRHPDAWHANEVMFSVNLTSTALHDEHFIKFVELCLAKSSLPKGTIAFEIDAPTALTLADKISNVATALHRLGCPLVLDDFALRTECFELLRLPGVRYVKLAPELTSKMRSDKVSQAAITAVVQMSRVLGMHTVAKRTDTAAEQEWLTALGVDFVQSNAISPAASIDSLIKTAAAKI
ncbi:MAG TPA: EAL domain-containing protein [Steroidobacteraceae bacterium]|jgi:EAL domain-containing protein (putative c-di-GMP-specific phosphodiesterase class I)